MLARHVSGLIQPSLFPQLIFCRMVKACDDSSPTPLETRASSTTPREYGLGLPLPTEGKGVEVHVKL